MKKTLHVVLWTVEFVLGLAAILAVLIFTMPWLLRFDATRSIIFATLKGPLKAEVSIEKMQVGWWSKTEIEGLVYKSSDRKLVLCCEKITTPSSLWMILFGTHELGNLEIQKPTVALLFEKAKPIEFQNAGPLNFHPDLSKFWKNLTPHLSGNIALEEGLIFVQSKDVNEIRIENITVAAEIPKSANYVKFQMLGNTRQAENTGSLHFLGNFGPLESEDPILSFQGDIEKLPIYAIDQLNAIFYPEWQGVILAAMGPSLDLKTNVELSRRRFDLSFTASSSQFNADVRLLTQENKVSLIGPARFGLTLTAALAERFFSLSPYLLGMQLASSPRVTINLQELLIPTGSEGIDWNQLQLRGELALLNMQVSTPAVFQGISLDRFKATFQSQNFSEQLLFDATSKISFGDKIAQLAASGEIARPLEKLSPLTLAISTTDFPVVILDQVMSSSGFLQDLVGSSCSFDGAIETSQEGRSAILYFKSQTIELADAHFQLLDDGLILKTPIHLNFAPTRAFWDKHANGMGLAPSDIAIEELDYRFGKIDSVKMKGVATSSQLFYKRFSLPNVNLRFDLQTLLSMTLKLATEGLQANLNLKYDGKANTLSLLSPLDLSIQFSQERSSLLWKELGVSLPLESALALNANVAPFSTPLGQNFMKGALVQGKAEIPSFSIKSKDNIDAFVQNTNMQWRLDASAGKFFCKLDTLAGSEASSLTPLHAEVLVQNFYFQPKMNFKDVESLIKISFDKLDTRFFDVWDENHRFSSLFGNYLTAKMEIATKPSYTSLNLDATAEKGTLSFTIAKEKDVISLLSKTLKANFAFDDASVSCLGMDLPVRLQKPTQIALSLSSLYFPLSAEQIQDIKIDGTLQTDYLFLAEKSTNNPINLSHLFLKVTKQDLASPLLLNLKASIEGNKLGQVDVKSTIGGIVHTDARWDYSKIQANISANFQQLPSSLVDTVATALQMQPGVFPVLFGDYISGNLATNIEESSGPIILSITSPSTRVSLNGNLQKGTLLLNEPFFAQVTMTEGISRLFLKGINPLSISAVKSEGPMTLTIENRGFSLPIFPWDIEKATVSHMRIEVGKLLCRNTGNIHTAIGLLKLGQFSNTNDLKLWFAPMDLSITGGVIDCERTEILVADSIEIATWGKVYLKDNWVDAILGLTAQALSKAFGITGLPETYVLQIPMKGPIDDVTIDTKKATAKVALLLAAENASSAGSLFGGQAGGLVGGIVGQIAKLPDANSKAPPPKHPFPWEESPRSSTQIPAKKRKNAIKSTDKPIKQILKLLK